MRKVFILLTQFPTFSANIMKVMTMYKYTHASIGLEEDMNTFYSFINKGFIVEKITRYVKPDRKPFSCKLYEMDVSNRVYDRIKELLNGFERNKKSFKYSKWGIALSLLHIPYKKKKEYFCSQFVASILAKSRGIILKKSTSLYLPRDFTKIPGIRLKFKGTHKTMLHHFKLV